MENVHLKILTFEGVDSRAKGIVVFNYLNYFQSVRKF